MSMRRTTRGSGGRAMKVYDFLEGGRRLTVGAWRRSLRQVFKSLVYLYQVRGSPPQHPVTAPPRPRVTSK